MKNMEAVCFVVGVFGVIHSSTYSASTAPACTSRPADSQIVTQLMLYSQGIFLFSPVFPTHPTKLYWLDITYLLLS